DDAHHAARRGELGLQESRLADVAPPGPEGLHRTDHERAAELRVQQAAEDRVAIEARHAPPVDRAGAGDEGSAPAVADQPVVADGRITFLNPQADRVGAVLHGILTT